MWEKVQKILTDRNMTINQLSNLMGYTRNSTLYSFKNRKIKKPSFELMEKIADALDVSMDEFRTK
ncbi:helix-turn-helix domain-containing protein [Pediococcus pentosaceus]|uniref:helix-turn-helix domain-containing protein n=1 Tax=Pediococcus pentosaceus TaxID=1255 RepID=UPI0021E7E7F6|nr:helix-turn-helix transcriptional regulator [Pediococcus pentosaceus]MCV3330421.1 helix-turn-helix domain-containing protein [Pediococcus pentosaceus]